jgi:hypothetical protein
MPQIELALKGKAEFMRAANGVSDPADETPETKPPEDVAAGLASFLRRRT